MLRSPKLWSKILFLSDMCTLRLSLQWVRPIPSVFPNETFLNLHGKVGPKFKSWTAFTIAWRSNHLAMLHPHTYMVIRISSPQRQVICVRTVHRISVHWQQFKQSNWPFTVPNFPLTQPTYPPLTQRSGQLRESLCGPSVPIFPYGIVDTFIREDKRDARGIHGIRYPDSCYETSCLV